jgi:cytochrome P450
MMNQITQISCPKTLSVIYGLIYRISDELLRHLRGYLPSDDLAGVHINDQDLLAQVVFLLAAGNETTANLLSNGLTVLIDHPDVCRRLAEESDRIPTAVEEMLRYDPPIHLTARRAARDTRLGDKDIQAGTSITQVLPAANRDPRRFTDPDSFDIERANNQHLTFNHGLHFCIGAPLARLEGEVMFRRLLKRFAGINPGSQPPVRRTTNVGLRGWQSRPVVLDTVAS